MADNASIYTLGGGRAPTPGPLARLKAALVLGGLIVVGAVILTGILALGLVMLPFVLIAAIAGWVIIRHRIRRALRAMESRQEDTAGRENVRVRRPTMDTNMHEGL